MYNVYLTEFGTKRIVATFADLYDAAEYVEFMKTKYASEIHKKWFIKEA